MASISLPPFPSPASELEEFLLSPEHLPIHNFRNKQSWVMVTKYTFFVLAIKCHAAATAWAQTINLINLCALFLLNQHNVVKTVLYRCSVLTYLKSSCTIARLSLLLILAFGIVPLNQSPCWRRHCVLHLPVYLSHEIQCQENYWDTMRWSPTCNVMCIQACIIIIIWLSKITWHDLHF